MRVVLLALALAIGCATAGQAQGSGAGPDDTRVEPPAAQAPASTEAGVDASKLGVSMSRIRKGLRLTETREEQGGSPLRLEYQVQVFGTAPRIDILEGFDIGKGTPLSYGAPTHSDFVNLWTPGPFRAPVMPLSAVAGWALTELGKRSARSKCEQEIADYRAAVMQGVSMAAPRCAQ